SRIRMISSMVPSVTASLRPAPVRPKTRQASPWFPPRGNKFRLSDRELPHPDAVLPCMWGMTTPAVASAAWSNHDRGEKYDTQSSCDHGNRHDRGEQRLRAVDGKISSLNDRGRPRLANHRTDRLHKHGG